MRRIIHCIHDKNVMIARCFADEQGLKECFEQLTELGFGPLNFGGYMMKYHYSDLRTQDGFKKIAAHTEAVNALIPLSKVPKELIDTLTSENIIQRMLIESGSYDSDATMALIENGSITCIMYVCACGEHGFIAPVAFLDVKARYDMVIPFLLTGVALQLEKLYGPDFDLMFCPSYERGHEGFLKLFGSPAEETRIHDYSLVFRDPSEGERCSAAIEALPVNSAEGPVPFEEYFDIPAMGWLSIEAAQRIPYISDIRKMPKQKLDYTKKELFTWFERWGLPATENWKKVVFDCGKAGGTINSLSINCIYNRDCEEIFDNIRKTGIIPEPERLNCTPDDIELCILPDEEEALYEILPEHIKKHIFDHDFLVVGALSPEHEIIGITVIDRMSKSLPIGYVRYAYVLPGIDPEPVYRRMIRLAAGIVYDSGCSSLYLKELYREGGAGYIDAPAIYDDLGICLEEDESRLMCYNIRRICEGRLLEIMNDSHLKLPEITFPENVNSKVLMNFRRKCIAEGHYFDPDSYDRQYTGMIIEGGEIVGAIFADQVSERELSIRDIYILPNMRGEYVSAALLLSTLKKAAENMPEDAVVLLRISSKAQCEALVKTVGTPLTADVEKEYLYLLRGSAFENPADPEAYMPPEDISVKRGFLEKLRLSSMLYSGKLDVEHICALLLDMSSQIPGCRMCTFIAENYK